MDKRTVLRPAAMGLTTLGALGRVAPHMWNFTSVGSACLFSGAKVAGWQGYAIPLAVLALTEPIVDAYYGTPVFTKSALFVFLSFAISIWIGRQIRAKATPARIATASLASSTQFFLLTNFGVWLGSKFYAQTPAGLATCYTAALPFYAYTAVGDLLFAGVLFGIYAVLSRRAEAAPAQAHVAA